MTVKEKIDELYRAESRRVIATLVRQLGDFDLAEEAMRDAFTVTMHHWKREGVPENPRAWLVSTGRFKVIDAVRRNARFNELAPQVSARLDEIASADSSITEQERNGGRTTFIRTFGCFYSTRNAAFRRCVMFPTATCKRNRPR